MERWRGLDAVPAGWGRCVATIGVFDGVHRGHQHIIGRAVARAADTGVPSAVVTFDPHPSEVVRPGSRPAMLTTPRHKAELIERLGVDALWVLPFTVEFSRMAADEFVHLVLVERLHANVVVVGANFRFGHKAAGDVALLATLGRRFGFVTEGVPLLRDGGIVFSSTYVRSCVDAGDVAAAAVALGRPHRVEGVVVRGDRRGRELGFPTANVEPVAHAAVPGDGVYAGELCRRSGPLPAAISIGTNPTYEGRARTVVAYAIDVDVDLYGEHVAVDFVARLRGMSRFESAEALTAQMHRDVARARDVLRDGAAGGIR